MKVDDDSFRDFQNRAFEEFGYIRASLETIKEKQGKFDEHLHDPLAHGLGAVNNDRKSWVAIASLAISLIVAAWTFATNAGNGPYANAAPNSAVVKDR